MTPAGRPRRAREVAVVAGLLAGLLALTALVAADPGWLRAIDGAVGRAAYDATAGHERVTAVWLAVGSLGQPWAPRLVLLVLAGLLLARRRRVLAGWLLLVVGAEVLLAPAAKLVLERDRPRWGPPIEDLASTSFPSGHATAVAVLVVALPVVLPALAAPSAVRRALVAVAALGAAVVCADRLFLGVHYLSDVVGGVLLGALVVRALLLLVPVAHRTGPPDVTRP